MSGRGSPAIRATHGKTLEFTPDAVITERASCVVATATTVEPARPLAGRVRIVITAGDQSATVYARANPEWDPAGPAVVRRSPLRLPGTLATHADTAAADLPRELVTVLRDPDVPVVIDVEPAPDDEPVLVLFAAPTGASPALTAEVAAADVVVAEDAAARALTGRADPPPKTITGRVLVVATDDEPGATITFDRERIETVGLPPRLAVAAASPSRSPVAFVPGPADLADPPAAYRVVVATGAAELAALLETARRVRGTTTVTLAQRHTPPWQQLVDEPPELPSRDTVYCCLHPSAAVVDPRVHAAVVALLAEGVPTRAAARALAELTGWPRRRAYDAVLAIGRQLM